MSRAGALFLNIEQVVVKTSGVLLKSPLRYPGGKSRAVNTIRQFMPSDLKSICSPFFGGGSLELSCAADGITVYGSDSFELVVDFWQAALTDSAMLAQQVCSYYPLAKAQFYSLQKSCHTLKSPLARGAAFYVINRCSFSGTTLSGGMSPGHPRFTESAISRLRDFKADNLFVECADYKDALREHANKFLYLDPPYANGGKLYGDRGDKHEGFNHGELAEILRQRGDWLLSYNDCKLVRDLYKGYEIIAPQWSYGMNSDKASNEVLILA